MRISSNSPYPFLHAHSGCGGIPPPAYISETHVLEWWTILTGRWYVE